MKLYTLLPLLSFLVKRFDHPTQIQGGKQRKLVFLCMRDMVTDLLLLLTYNITQVTSKPFSGPQFSHLKWKGVGFGEVTGFS